jgi:hypothetical protein
MRLRRFMPLLILPAALWVSFGRAGTIKQPPCRMRPARIEIHLPKRGFVWLKGEGQSGACHAVPSGKWIRSPAGASDLFVLADGPSGSGRYWTVTVGVATRGRTNPERGVCFETNTVGWRTLQRLKDAPLPWIEDLDHHGKAELIVWESFALRQDASMAEFGLAAWAYRLTPDNSLALDWDLSRQLARAIAAAYRSPLDRKDALLEKLRAEAAGALEQFAAEECSVPPGEVR